MKIMARKNQKAPWEEEEEIISTRKQLSLFRS
jgi:hypothetical protein